MSNQDQYGKSQGGQADPNDDWDSLTDEQKMQRKQPYIDQDDQGDGSGKPGAGPRMDLGDDFDSLSDEQKIARKQEYAQRDPQTYGSEDDNQGGGGKY